MSTNPDSSQSAKGLHSLVVLSAVCLIVLAGIFAVYFAASPARSPDSPITIDADNQPELVLRPTKLLTSADVTGFRQLLFWDVGDVVRGKRPRTDILRNDSADIVVLQNIAGSRSLVDQTIMTMLGNDVRNQAVVNYDDNRSIEGNRVSCVTGVRNPEFSISTLAVPPPVKEGIETFDKYTQFGLTQIRHIDGLSFVILSYNRWTDRGSEAALKILFKLYVSVVKYMTSNVVMFVRSYSLGVASQLLDGIIPVSDASRPIRCESSDYIALFQPDSMRNYHDVWVSPDFDAYYIGMRITPSTDALVSSSTFYNSSLFRLYFSANLPPNSKRK